MQMHSDEVPLLRVESGEGKGIRVITYAWEAQVDPQQRLALHLFADAALRSGMKPPVSYIPRRLAEYREEEERRERTSPRDDLAFHLEDVNLHTPKEYHGLILTHKRRERRSAEKAAMSEADYLRREITFPDFPGRRKGE